MCEDKKPSTLLSMVSRTRMCSTHTSIVLLSVFQIFLILPVSLFATRNEVRCGTIDIRNNPKWAFQPRHQNDKPSFKYKECTILEGDFTISMITQPNVTDSDFPVFEKLREITGSILVFQIRGLQSLGKMFPNLRVIGGHSLIMNYALVIYQNSDLREVGLTKLTAIKNGGVRITENPRLCYAKNINWRGILMGKIRDIIIDELAIQCRNECPGVTDDTHCYRDPINSQIACWNSTECQKTCLNSRKTNAGCTEGDELCHEECIGGCTKPNDPTACNSCRHLELNGECVRKCGEGLFEQLGRKCLSKEECDALPPVNSNLGGDEKSMWKAFKKQCNYECPTGFQEDPYDPHACIKCLDYCPKKCGGDTIDSISTALKFSKCNMVEGNLEIDLRIGIETASADKFTEAFGEIEEITGYLLIRFSSAFMSLHMFTKLRRIHGQQLYKHKYAIAVFENPNLHQLFNTDRQRIELLRGSVSFQNNRMLCYQKIEKFVKHLGLAINDTDVSEVSNGDKAICQETNLEVKIVSVYSYGFVVSWTPFNTTDLDHRKFLGYQIFYKKVNREDPDMNINDDRSACSDSWNMYFVPDETDLGSGENMVADDSGASQLKGELINQGVEANTLYAVYVQTRLVNHPGARNAISKIVFVKTLFAAPEPPRMKVSEALSPSSIKLSWDPPVEPFGDITHYKITWNLVIEYDTVKSTDVCDNKRFSPIVSNLPTKIASPSQDTCSSEGCCKCSEQRDWTGGKKVFNANELDSKRKESDSFEDALQNAVFVQNCEVNFDPNHCNGLTPAPNNKMPATEMDSESHIKKRQKHNVFEEDVSANDDMPIASPLLNALVQIAERTSGAVASPAYSRSPRARRAIGAQSGAGRNAAPSSMFYYNDTELNVSENNSFSGVVFNYTIGVVNVTGTTFILSGLPHFTEYHIMVHACQNVSVPENYCSNRPAWTSARTLSIPEYDMVDPTTVVVFNSTEEERPNDKRIYWEPPTNPNGIVLAYRAKLTRDKGSMPLEKCISYEQFVNESGVLFPGIPDGLYTLEIRVETSSMTNSNITIIPDIFEIYTPGFFTPKIIVIIASVSLFLIIVVGIFLYYFINRLFGKKVEEYWRQTISANPEYLSQMELYKADEWELKRDEIVLEEEIGRGTFGKVFRGYGKQVHTINNEVFGDCAVKTVPETASNAERLHFLIEASVMKQFNTPYIVKLYGVVSDGQPVLVVMELMEKGNLRDFLRSHRPGAEENKENRPLPTAENYFNWAAQIADGMAYLESLKFCHRDLAARNCMVHAQESVKIGDFGMARDIYYHEYYKPAGKRLMPVRWMAPESLKDGKFTLKSDVWSYGIVLYEMLTLGQQPYAGLGNDQVFNYTGVQRHVLHRPTGCPDFWYALMLLCWKYDPRERPSFRQIVRYLDSFDFIAEEFKRQSFVLNEKSSEADEMYHFEINLDDELLKRNLNNEEFMYGMDEDDEEDGDMADFASEDELQQKQPICINNRRDTEKCDDDGTMVNAAKDDLMRP